MSPEIKNYIDQAILRHIHDGNFAQRVNLFDIFGNIQTVDVEPVDPPSNIYDQFKIYNDTLYVYNFFTATWITGGGGLVIGGSDTEIQFNDSGVLAGNPGFTYDNSAEVIGILNNELDIITSGGGAPDAFIFMEGGNGNSVIEGGPDEFSLRGTDGALGTNNNGANVNVVGGQPDGTGAIGDVLLNFGTIATTAKGGFVGLPKTAGTPTGVPNNGAGVMVYDTSANKIWVYNGSWRSVAVT